MTVATTYESLLGVVDTPDDIPVSSDAYWLERRDDDISYISSVVLMLWKQRLTLKMDIMKKYMLNYKVNKQTNNVEGQNLNLTLRKIISSKFSLQKTSWYLEMKLRIMGKR